MTDDEMAINLRREQRRAEELAYLYQLTLDLMGRLDAPVIVTCEIMIDSLLSLLDCQRAAILLRDEQTGEPRIISERGESDWIIPKVYEPLVSTGRALVSKSDDGASHLGVVLRADADWIGLLLARRDPNYSPFKDDEIQLITLLAGVTAMVLLNDQLRRSLTERLDLLQTVMEGSPGGLAVFDIRHGHLLMANPAALHALQLNENTFDYPLTIDGPDGPLVERLAEALPPSRDTTFEYRIVTGTRTRYVRIEVVPVSVDKLLAQINDVTLLREIESRRDAAVASASHDLKTPLAVINLGLSNLLAYYEETPDAQRRALIEEALDQVMAMRTSISGLLKQARGGHYSATTSDTDGDSVNDAPIACIHQVINELVAFSRYHGVSVFLNKPPECAIRVAGTFNDLKMIARNLITNAIKYTPSGGQVTADAYCDSNNGTFTLVVRDTGVGIPINELAAIFEPGYRATTGHMVEGGGLGLSFVRETVTRLGGTIQVESVVNSGSKFIVTLPTVERD
ncbi:MAG: ATP-binding protein [Aggregatilineales bacterium]